MAGSRLYELRQFARARFLARPEADTEELVNGLEPEALGTGRRAPYLEKAP